MNHVDVEMDHVEFVPALANLVQHGEVGGEVGFRGRWIETDRLIADRDEPGFSVGVGAGEQRHLVPKIHQGVAKMSNHPLGAPVEFRRHGFIEGSDLGDFH